MSGYHPRKKSLALVRLQHILSTVEPASSQQWTAQSHCWRGGAAEAVGLGQLLPQDLGDFRVALLEIMHVKVVACGVEEEARPAVGVYFGAERGWCARTLAWRRERARETGAGDRAEAVAAGREEEEGRTTGRAHRSNTQI